MKGTQFREHHVVGDILELATYYSENNADELVFYDITASSDDRCVDVNWVEQIARYINIPFCVAGGIRNLKQAETILNAGADKISVNSPALENPNLIDEFAKVFGSQCVVVGIDSFTTDNGFQVYQYTGDSRKTINTARNTLSWVKEVQERGAGEVVLNCMNQDGVRKGYDILQLKKIREIVKIPLIASGGAGAMIHFADVFQYAQVEGALAASVFHKKIIDITLLKFFLANRHVEVRQ